MEKISKFKIKVSIGRQKAFLPEGGILRKLSNKGQNILIWYQHDKEAILEPCYIEIYKDGQDIVPLTEASRIYIGNINVTDTDVLHLFEFKRDVGV